MAEKITYSSVLSNRGFRFLWFNQILVQLSLNTLNFALIIWVYKLVGSNLAISALMLSIYLPVIFFGIFAGVFVDLADRRKIILLVDILLSLSFLTFIFIKSSFPLILFNTFLINSFAQFFLPSESSSIPILLKRRQLFLANSLFSLTLYGSFMIGSSISGPILNHVGLNMIFYLGAGMLAVAFLLSYNLPVIKVSRGSRFANFLSFSDFQKTLVLTQQEITHTINFIKGKLAIFSAIGLMSLVQVIIGILAVMMPSYLEKVLVIHATDASYFVMLPLGFGMITGALIVGKLFHNRPKRSIVIPAIIGAGIILTLMGIVPTLARLLQAAELPSYLSRPRYFIKAPSLSSFFAVLAYLSGFFLVSIIIPCQTVLQESTTEQNRGKIFATLAVVMTGFSAIPVILAGSLSDLFGVTPLLITLGITIFIFGFCVSRPHKFFSQDFLSTRMQEFLGRGHWDKE